MPHWRLGQESGLGLSVQAQANATTGAPLLNAGSTVFAQVQIRDTSKLAPNIFTGDNAGFGAYGTSAEFTFTLGSGITYPVMWGQSGTWPAGTFNLTSMAREHAEQFK